VKIWRVSLGQAAIIVGALLLASCTTFTSAPFERVLDGRALDNPVNVDKLKVSIRMALIAFNWRTVSQTENSFTAEFQKEAGEISATIKVVFSSTGYRIEYVDSRGLNVDLTEKTIHRNYMRWIRNLDKEIAINYYKEK
jgi:hypothetical protein